MKNYSIIKLFEAYLKEDDAATNVRGIGGANVVPGDSTDNRPKKLRAPSMTLVTNNDHRSAFFNKRTRMKVVNKILSPTGPFADMIKEPWFKKNESAPPGSSQPIKDTLTGEQAEEFFTFLEMLQGELGHLGAEDKKNLSAALTSIKASNPALQKYSDDRSTERQEQITSSGGNSPLFGGDTTKPTQ